MERLAPTYRPLKVKVKLNPTEMKAIFNLLNWHWKVGLAGPESHTPADNIYHRAMQDWLYKQNMNFIAKIAENRKSYSFTLKGSDAWWFYEMLYSGEIPGSYELALRRKLTNAIISVL